MKSQDDKWRGRDECNHRDGGGCDCREKQPLFRVPRVSAHVHYGRVRADLWIEQL